MDIHITVTSSSVRVKSNGGFDKPRPQIDQPTYYFHAHRHLADPGSKFKGGLSLLYCFTYNLTHTPTPLWCVLLSLLAYLDAMLRPRAQIIGVSAHALD